MSKFSMLEMNFWKSFLGIGKRQTAFSEASFIGEWRSVDEIEVLDYNSNFSNWTGRRPIPGYFLLDVGDDQELTIAKIGIPVEGDGFKGHFYVYKGRLELVENEILIWQNDQTPVRITYYFKSGILTLSLFQRRIAFTKKVKLEKT